MGRKNKIKFIENIKINKVGYGGIGIGEIDDSHTELRPTDIGKKVLVKGGILPGSVVDVKINKFKKDYFEGQITKIKSIPDDLKLSDDLCPHYLFEDGKNDKIPKGNKGCGGCKWQIMPYADQLKLKHDIAIDSFRNIKDVVDEIGMQEFVCSPLEYNYRNKIEFTFGNYFLKDWTKKDEAKSRGEEYTGSVEYHVKDDWNFGFNKQGDFSKVVDVNSCRLISKEANKLFEYLKAMFKDSGLPVYDKIKHTGFFRHMVIRQGFNTGHFLVNLVVAHKNLETSEQKEIWSEIQTKIAQDKNLKETVTSFVITTNNGLADIVRGQDIQTKVLWGDGVIYETLKYENLENKDFKESEVKFRVSPFSFFQTNTFGAQELFKKGADKFGKQDGVLLDLYCGAGAIGLSFLSMGVAKKVIGIEIVEDAIVDAKHNAKINGFDKDSYFVAGKAEKLIYDDDYIRNNLNEIGSIIVDPPREGLHKDVIKFLIDFQKIKPYKLLYISCNPVTMSRDIKLLLEGGFKLDQLQPVDMFPHTHHMEMIGLLNYV